MRPGSNTRRPRGRPNRKQHGSPRSQTFDSHGPDVRIRGNAPQVYEKYLTLARDATASGDRISAESYYQFAEHYFRIMNDSTDPQRLNSEASRPNREQPPQTPREQPQVEWPQQLDGASGEVAGKAEAPEGPAGAPPAASEEERPRRQPKGRPRGRRRATNGAKDPADEPAAKADGKPDGKSDGKAAAANGEIEESGPAEEPGPA